MFFSKVLAHKSKYWIRKIFLKIVEFFCEPRVCLKCFGEQPLVASGLLLHEGNDRSWTTLVQAMAWRLLYISTSVWGLHPQKLIENAGISLTFMKFEGKTVYFVLIYFYSCHHRCYGCVKIYPSARFWSEHPAKQLKI